MTEKPHEQHINSIQQKIDGNLLRRSIWEKHTARMWSPGIEYPAFQKHLDDIDRKRSHLFTRLDRLVSRNQHDTDAQVPALSQKHRNQGNLATKYSTASRADRNLLYPVPRKARRAGNKK